jgi:hypothetical protein
MTDRSYFKTNDAEVLRLLAARKEELQAIQKLARDFATEFGGKPLYSNDLCGLQFAGLTFPTPKSSPLWTNPDPKNLNRQRPRVTVKGASAAEKVALAELRARWDASYPTQRSDFTPVLKAMGTDWGNCMFGGGGFAFFEHGGFAWVTTGVKLAPCMQEVKASEYLAAKAEFERVKEAA